MGASSFCVFVSLIYLYCLVLVFGNFPDSTNKRWRQDFSKDNTNFDLGYFSEDILQFEVHTVWSDIGETPVAEYAKTKEQAISQKHVLINFVQPQSTMQNHKQVKVQTQKTFKDLHIDTFNFAKISHKSLQFVVVAKNCNISGSPLSMDVEVATDNNKFCGRRSLIYVKNERKFWVNRDPGRVRSPD